MNKHTSENLRNKWQDLKTHIKLYECRYTAVGVVVVIVATVVGTLWYIGG